MIDHTGILVSDFERSKDFYARALAPLGYEILMELSAEVTGHTDTAGFGEPPKPDFWISGGTPSAPAGCSPRDHSRLRAVGWGLK